MPGTRENAVRIEIQNARLESSVSTSLAYKDSTSETVVARNRPSDTHPEQIRKFASPEICSDMKAPHLERSTREPRAEEAGTGKIMPWLAEVPKPPTLEELCVQNQQGASFTLIRRRFSDVSRDVRGAMHGTNSLHA